ncbi:MAG: hypothetical protein KJ674_04085 [Nanoarchaeota archaeon]|nr:hypothetical protein [Nanoarchaeota archaeon]
MKKVIFLLIIGIFLICEFNLISASRLPTVNGDSDAWGSVLNDFLSRIVGNNATELNLTMVNGTNIYSSSINTTHLLDGTITADDLGTDSISDDEIDYTTVTLTDFTNDANYLDKDEGGTIDGSLIINGNLSLIGSYLNATVTNQYLNGSIFPDITKLFDLGSSIFMWNNLYLNKIFADDWTNVTITESQVIDLQSYLTSESDPVYSAWDKDYGDLINTPAALSIWDETFNTTGDSRWNGGGNLSFNQTLTDTLYAAIGLGGDNSSWNESYADTKYADISITGDNSSWNESMAHTLFDSTYNITYESYAINGTTITYQNISNIPTCGANEHLDFDGATLSCTADAGGTSLWTNSSGNATYIEGSVGIGTITPTHKLNVVGNVNVTGNINIESSGTVLLLPQENTEAAPTLAFGNGDTGIYEVVDNTLAFTFSGGKWWSLNSGAFYSATTNGPYIDRSAASTTNPVYTFDSDTDTGLGWGGANNLSFIIGGTEKMRLDDLGNLGIGITTPSERLDVSGNINVNSNNITTVDCIVFASGGKICDSP